MLNGIQKPFSLSEIGYNSIQIKAWITKYIHVEQWDVIAHPCFNLNNTLGQLALQLGNE